MRRYVVLWSCLIALAASGSRASAEPIQYVATFFLGLDGVPTMKPVNLPDPVLGGSVVLGGLNLPHIDPTASFSNPAAQQPIDKDFSFQLGIKSPLGSSGPMVNPYLNVLGHIMGSINGPDGMPARYSGGFAGSATSITIPFEPPGTTLSPALLELLQQPSRIHLSGIVTGGSANYLQTTLTIDPLVLGNPTLVPEPGSFATFATLVACMFALRKYRSRRA